jgi:hypothetical protein
MHAPGGAPNDDTLPGCTRMQRVLDLDLDSFLDGVAHWIAYDGDRLDGGEYPPWPIERVLAFLEEQCGLSGRLPGFVVEQHAELFAHWRQAIDSGLLTPPFSVTHVDAHADLGLGDAGYVHLMSELLFKPVEERRFPKVGASGLDDGNWVSFAVACRWIGELTYVFNTTEPHPGDILSYVMEGFDPYADHLQLPAVCPADIHALTMRLDKAPIVHHYEPKVPFRALPWRDFQATQPFDVVCLTRSPAFTPAESDALFEEIRARFIDEAALGDPSARHSS